MYVCVCVCVLPFFYNEFLFTAPFMLLESDVSFFLGLYVKTEN